MHTLILVLVVILNMKLIIVILSQQVQSHIHRSKKLYAQSFLCIDRKKKLYIIFQNNCSLIIWLYIHI